MTVPAEWSEIGVEDLAAILHAAPVLIDVRTAAEFAEAHIPGAQLVPLPVLVAQDTTLAAGGPVYLVCSSGVRSARAAETLRAHGVDAVVVVGGVRAWTEAGRPVVTGY